MQYTLYILKSLPTNRFYIGHTNNIDRRLDEHNSGHTKSTKPYRPWIVAYQKKYDSKQEVSQAEIKIKKRKSRTFIEKLINQDITL